MKIKHSYRGNQKEYTDCDISLSKLKSSLRLSERKWTDGSERLFFVEIEAGELLKVAKACIDKVNEIAETDYVITRK